MNKKKTERKTENKPRARKLIVINRTLRISLITISIALSIIFSYLVFKTYNYQKYTEKKYIAYSYNNRAAVNYEVTLGANNIYSEKVIGEGNIYIAKLVESINTKLVYRFNGSRAAKATGKYNIIAVLEGFLPGDNNNSAIWSKEFILKPDTAFSGDNNSVDLKCELPLSLKSYNLFIEEASKSAEINFISKLTIKWNITTDAITEVGNINETITPVMEIPLGAKYFQIGGKLSDEKQGNIEKTVSVISPSYNFKIVTYSSSIVICAALLILMIFFTKAKEALSDLDKKRKALFKEHGARFVGIMNDISDISKIIIEVISIEDLVKVADDIGRPIIYKSHEEEKEINNFYVIDEEKVYMFDIRNRVSNCLIQDINGNNLEGTSINI